MLKNQKRKEEQDKQKEDTEAAAEDMKVMKRGNSWDQDSGAQWSGSGRAKMHRGGDGA